MNNENIADRFSRFEPEIGELVIDQNWERIKYFVPQKEKKRRAFFLFTNLSYGIMSGLLILCSIVTIFFYFNSNGDPAKTITSSETTFKSENIHQKKMIVLPNSSASNSGKKHSNTHISPSKNNQTLSEIKSYFAGKSHGKSSPIMANSNDAPWQSTQKKILYPYADTFLGEDSVTFEQLIPLLTVSISAENDKDLWLQTENNKLLKSNRIYVVELFAGGQTNYGDVTYINKKENRVATSTGFFAGAAFNCQLKNKFGFVTQVIISRNLLDYHKGITQNRNNSKQNFAKSAANRANQFIK
jgi:hypothetical protein